MKKFPYLEVMLVVLGTILYFFANVQRVAVPGAVFDVLQHDLHATAKQITSLGTVFMYVYAISQLILGVLIARFGGFMVITLGSILFFTGCLIFPMTNSLPVLYISRLLIGFGSASFYLGLINETKKLVSNKNFGIVISIILLFGYFGGIVANAPLVICVHNLGWHQTFLITGLIIMSCSVLFLLINSFRQLPKYNNDVKFNLNLFKEVLINKKNIYLYLATSINYGIIFVLLTVIGKKFIEDFYYLPVFKSALILSIASAFYAISGPLIACISKLWYYKKAIFLKLATLNTLLSTLIILVSVMFNFHIGIIAYLICSMAILSNLSPLSIPLLHDYNSDKQSTTAVSILTCAYYLAVGLFSSFVGFLLDLFTPISKIATQNSKIIYTNQSYIAIFVVLTILAITAFVSSLKIDETKTTKRLISWYHEVKE